MATTNYITGLKGTDNTTYYLNEGVDTRFFRGTCSTAKGTAAKTVTLDDSTNFSLTAGVKIAITFINGSDVHSTAASLNVNSTGAKTVIVTDVSNTALDSTSVLVTYDNENIYAPVMVCQPYEVMFFVYNGTNWVQIGTSASVNFVALHHAWVNADRLDMIGSTNNVIKVQHGGTGMTTTTDVNAVVIGNSTNAENDMQTVATANGAFYATAANGKPKFGTLPIAQGGTSKTSWTQWGIVYASKSNELSQVAAGATTNNGYLLQSNGAAAPSWINATSANTASTIVKRDTNGNFSAGTITADLSGNATSANYLSTYIANGTSNLEALKSIFDDIPKSRGTAIRLQHGSHSMALGWFLDGYAKANAYGGWFISDYGTPRWIGVDNGTWNEQKFITDTNYTDYKASTTAYGVTKLSSTSSSSEQSLAATPKLVYDSIAALDVSNITGFGAGKTLSALSETDGKISATFQDISIAPSQINDTIPVSKGGTGATTFTSGALLIGNGTSAVSTRSITNNTTDVAVGTGTTIPTMNTIYHGLAQINGNSQKRDVTIYAPTAGGTSGYYLKGAGTTTAPTWQAPSDSSSASAISTGTALATERDIYYGLPTINGAHNYTSNTNIYAPTAVGTSGQILSSSGSGAPTWVDSSTIGSKIQIVRW